MTTIDTIRMRDYERFEANRRFEEMTDIAERLGYPIDTTIQYEMRDGAAYCLSDTTDRPFHNQTLQAMLSGAERFTGDQAFEADRLRLEHEEALLVDAFGRDELSGNVLIKFSKVPDAVVDGVTSINGYRRDLLRSFVRIYTRTDAGVDCRLFTLDGNSRTGMYRAGEVLAIDTLQPSEKVLGDHTLLMVEDDVQQFVDDLAQRTKSVYDEGRFAETNEHSYAGSRYGDKQNAMTVVAEQTWLIAGHMDAITDIMQRGLSISSRDDLLEAERQRTAAAIKLASNGIDIASSSDASVVAEVESGNYDRECATSTGMNQAQQNMENIWAPGECQVCFAKTMVGSCRVCATCAAADDRGVDLLQLREKNLRRLQTKRALGRSASIQPNQQPARRPSKQDQIRQAYGDKAELYREMVVGGERHYVRNKVTKEIITRLR